MALQLHSLVMHLWFSCKAFGVAWAPCKLEGLHASKLGHAGTMTLELMRPIVSFHWTLNHDGCLFQHILARMLRD